jgi:hypothetical protein
MQTQKFPLHVYLKHLKAEDEHSVWSKHVSNYMTHTVIQKSINRKHRLQITQIFKFKIVNNDMSPTLIVSVMSKKFRQFCMQ